VADPRRLFFALWPEAGLRATITQTAVAVARERKLGGREVPPERVHLTLLFLGDVAARAEEILVAGAGRLALPAFDLTLDQAGCFFRSRAFWLGASATPRRLTALAEALRGLAAGVGIEPDARPLAPHVTCVRDIEHVIRPVQVKPVIWRVRGFALVHSTLGDLPQYHVVSHWPLQTAPIASVKTVQEPGGPE
jgi:RNA 2',3'-cyclic 3'-phosphodiesterase